MNLGDTISTLEELKNNEMHYMKPKKDDKRFACSYCNKSLQCKPNVKRHMKRTQNCRDIQEGAKSEVCLYCKTRYTFNRIEVHKKTCEKREKDENGVEIRNHDGNTKSHKKPSSRTPPSPSIVNRDENVSCLINKVRELALERENLLKENALLKDKLDNSEMCITLARYIVNNTQKKMVTVV